MNSKSLLKWSKLLFFGHSSVHWPPNHIIEKLLAVPMDFWSEKVITTDFFMKVKKWTEFYLWFYCFNDFGHSSVHWPRLIIEKLLAVLMDLGVKIEQNYPSSMWIPLHLNHEALPLVWKLYSCVVSSISQSQLLF